MYRDVLLQEILSLICYVLSMQLIQVRQALSDSMAICNVLKDDLEICLNSLVKEPNGFWMRTYVHTLFAFVEGINFGFKKTALTMHEHRACFDDMELSLLREVSYKLDARGNAKKKNKHLATLANIKFSTKAVAKAFGPMERKTFEDNGWKHFQDALNIRHRLTHPKSEDSLHISVDDVNTILKAAEWFVMYMNEVSKPMVSRVEEEESET